MSFAPARANALRRDPLLVVSAKARLATRATLAAIAIGASGCGAGSAAPARDGGPTLADAGSIDGGSIDDGASSSDAAWPPDAASVAGPEVCTMRLTGSFDETPTCACGATLTESSPTPLLTFSMFCKDPAHDYIPFQTSIAVGASTGPGTYAANSLDLTIADYGDVDGEATGSEDFVASGTSGCSVTLEAFAPATRGGVAARIECPVLVAGPSHVTLEGEVQLPAADVRADAGADADAGAGADAGAPSTCTMQLTGAYSTQVLTGTPELLPSQAPNEYVGCSISDGDLTIGASITGSSGGVTLDGRSWCAADCSTEYDGSCAVTSTRNDAVPGGRFVGTFACADLVAADGTRVAVYGSVDGIIGPPPE